MVYWGGGAGVFEELQSVVLPAVVQVPLQGRTQPAQVGRHLLVNLGEKQLQVVLGLALCQNTPKNPQNPPTPPPPKKTQP